MVIFFYFYFLTFTIKRRKSIAFSIDISTTIFYFCQYLYYRLKRKKKFQKKSFILYIVRVTPYKKGLDKACLTSQKILL